MPIAACNGDQSKAIATHPFDSGGTGYQVLHGLEIIRRQSNSPVRLGGAGCQAFHGLESN